jgi:hypothetical protein
MLMQIFATLFIGGFIVCAVIGHVALFHALFVRPAQPIQPPAQRKLRLVVQPRAEAAHERPASKTVEPALRTA